MCWRARRRSSFTSLTNDFDLMTSVLSLSLGTEASFLALRPEPVQTRCQGRGSPERAGGRASSLVVDARADGITRHFLRIRRSRLRIGRSGARALPRSGARGSGTRLASAGPGSQSSKQQGELAMNQDILAGKWKQMRGQVKQWWGKLTDDDLDRIDGTMDKLAGTFQERYGWERDEVDREIKKHFEQYEPERPSRR